MFRQFRLGVSVLLGLVALAALAADGSRMIERRGEEDDGQIAKAPYWAPAVAPNARVDDLHKEYYNIFQYGNRNAASHLWVHFCSTEGT
ncbi:hypothetical protein THAOC_13663 [Thalassiosira oceanica]|uniref:Uncharacterized protein n=1 Tax=Thalassiosira oceanica TaxID=159749 RepID=K0T4X7_THAOC|nr:hypothetical protein THAOC_13663 [Thalassiosira oceanica]|eukprot:EJK65467.1 hypothetical protein THAOC_13663 [Thalassiosira oceanica]